MPFCVEPDTVVFEYHSVVLHHFVRPLCRQFVYNQVELYQVVCLFVCHQVVLCVCVCNTRLCWVCTPRLCWGGQYLCTGPVDSADRAYVAGEEFKHQENKQAF